MEIKELSYSAPGTVPYFDVNKRVSWGAVLAGAFATSAATILLRSLGLLFRAVPAPPFGLAPGLHFGDALWWLVSGPACFYAGGWIAGRLTGIARVSESVIHGALSWAVVLVALAAWTGNTSAAAVVERGPSFFAFVVMGLELAAACSGAAAGTRLLVPSDLVSAETIRTRRETGALRP